MATSVVCPLHKKIVSNLYEGMDICPFECGHLPPLYKSAIRISVLFLYNTPPPPQVLCVKLRKINTQLIVFSLLFWDFVEWGGVLVIISIGRKLTCNLVLILTPDQPFDDLQSVGIWARSYRGWAPLEYEMAQNRPKLQLCMCGSRGWGGGGGWGPDPPRKVI